MNPTPLHILLIEDNVSTALEMEMNITEMGHHVLATVDRGDKALSYLGDTNLDMAIIDIGLRGAIDGVQVAERFKDAMVPFVFSTARQDTDTFERARSTNPVAYLVKPFDKLTLNSCIDQAIKIKKDDQQREEFMTDEETLLNDHDFTTDYFFVRVKGALHKVKFSDITYIQSDRNYSILHAKGRKYAAKISLNNLLQKLPQQQFARIHQSYIVSFDAIEKINVNEETVSISDMTLPLGKTYKSALMKRTNRI